METRLQALMMHVQEIEARLSSLRPPLPPPASTGQNVPALPGGVPAVGNVPSASGGVAPANMPFNVLMGQATGKIQLQPIGNTPGPFAPEIESLISKYAAQNSLLPDLVRAVIQQESGGNPRSRSAVDARGLMQLMPETAKGYGVTDAYDPEQNIAAGTRHLAGLLKKFQSVPLALAAYNAGSGAVLRAGGVPNFPETQQYVRKIMGMLGR